MKLKNKLFGLFLFITLSILFSSCETDIKQEMTTSQQAVEGKIKRVTIEDVPFLLPSVQKFKAKSNIKGVYARGVAPQELDLQNIIEYDDASNNSSYSIPIVDNATGGNDYYFENYNIITDGVTYESFILRYNPTDDSHPVDFGNFTGRMEFFSEVNKPVGKITFENSTARMVEPVVPTGGFEGSSGGIDRCRCSFIDRLFDKFLNLFNSIGNAISGLASAVGNISLSSASQGDPNNTGYVLAITTLDMGSSSGNTGSDFGSGGGGDYSIKVVPNVPKLFYPVSQGKEAQILNQLGFDDSTILPWLQDPTNKPFVDQAYFFIYEEDNVENRNFAREMISVLKDGGMVDVAYKVIVDKSLKNNPCLFEVYSKLGGSSTFQNYLQNFDGNFSVANLKLSVGTDPNHPLANAVTYPPASYLIEIKLNPVKLARPQLDVARTFIHELIHAEIYRKLLSCAKLPNLNVNNYSDSQWKAYITSLKNNFPGLQDYYMRYLYGVPANQQITDAQHELMAQHYRGIIIKQ